MSTPQPNEHIYEYLKYYCELENPPQFAVMLRGEWGSGKSWLISDFIRKNPELDFVKVSLYGATSAEEIAERVFAALHPILTSKGAVIAGRIIKGVLKTSLNLDLDGTNKLNVGADLGDAAQALIERPKSKLKGRILVLDDLERCNAQGQEIWGFINQLIEHEGAKVITVSHEGEIGDKDYQRTKEKTIGMSFTVMPDTPAVIQSLAKELNMPEFLHAEDSLRMFEQLFADSGCKSLRVLRFALRDCMRVWEAIPLQLQEKVESVKDALAACMLLSVEVYSGNLLPEEVSQLSGLGVMGRETPTESDERVSGILKKVERSAYVRQILPGPLWWQKFFSRGMIDQEGLESQLKRRSDPKHAPWKRLWDRDNLSDTDFKALLQQTWEQLKEAQFKSTGEVVHVAAIHLWASSEGLTAEKRPDVTQAAKNALEGIEPTEEEMNSYGLMLVGGDLPEVQSLLEYAENLHRELWESKLHQRADSVCRGMKNGYDEFERSLEHIDKRSGFLKLMKPSTFVESLIECSAQDQNEILREVQNCATAGLRPWLTQLQGEVEKTLPSDSIRRHVIIGRLQYIGERAS